MNKDHYYCPNCGKTEGKVEIDVFNNRVCGEKVDEHKYCGSNIRYKLPKNDSDENKHQEYLKNLQKEKWVIVYGKSNGNCQHPGQESITCGEYEKSVWLTPVGGNQVVVPAGYASRSGLWICPKHISNYELTN